MTHLTETTAKIVNTEKTEKRKKWEKRKKQKNRENGKKEKNEKAVVSVSSPFRVSCARHASSTGERGGHENELYGRSTQDGSLKSPSLMQRVEQPDDDECDQDYYLQEDNRVLALDQTKMAESGDMGRFLYEHDKTKARLVEWDQKTRESFGR